jgi:chemosensory pili system protein ChpC
MSVSPIRSLIIPVTGGHLLAPSAAIAEIVNYRDPDIPMEEPEWLLGLWNWRNQKIPLISIEKMLGINAAREMDEPRVIVFYGLYHTAALPFYGILARSMPHTLSIKPGLLSASKQINRPGLLASVMINDQQLAWLPDLQNIEQQLSDIVE